MRALKVTVMLKCCASVLLLLAMGTVLAACGSDEDDAGDQPNATAITTTLKEFGIELTSPTASAGEVKFKTVNSGALPHEFKAVKTDLAPDKLPLDGPKVEEGDVKVAEKTDELAAGETRDVTFKLSSGRYVLICNIEGHYQAGMHAAFSVQ